MRKIKKDITNIPSSLNNDTTNHKRLELIDVKKYISKSKYNDRYKMPDIKQILKSIYHNKCAYCEQKIEQVEIEHFRPKSIYYWLAYSWDNLLICCPKCNQYKSNNFETENKAVTINSIGISDIHHLSKKYDKIEKNKLINPENEDTTNLIRYTIDGTIKSKNTRVNYTIETCKLNRYYLCEERKQMINDFENKLISQLYEINSGNQNAAKKLEATIDNFIQDANNIKNNFTTFRKYIIKYLLNDLMSLQ